MFKSHFPNDLSIQALTVSSFMDHPQLQIGTKAPDIILKDINGKTIDLNKIDHSYLLIHFWASWCLPCRQETPDILKTYNNFNKKGFKVVMVSIDSDKKAWENAVKADSTSVFIHLIDLNAPKSKTWNDYKLFGVPDDFLIDRSGTIVQILSASTLYTGVSKLLAGN